MTTRDSFQDGDLHRLEGVPRRVPGDNGRGSSTDR